MTTPIRRAVLSVSDKTGLVEFARGLAAMGVELISTGGTMKTLASAGLKVRSVSDVTGFPEIMDGRVKTLHPAIFAGILARRSVPGDLETLSAQGIQPIDLVVVNLYPFEQTAARPGVSFEDVIENIDIGGPSMLRAAAKNFEDVAVVCDPAQYPALLDEMRNAGGVLSREIRQRLCRMVFEHTTRYDSAIAAWLRAREPQEEECAVRFPEVLNVRLTKVSDLRYGENPHQNAAYYLDSESAETSIPRARLLQGKPLSYNNIADLDTALDCIRDFEDTAAVILKHANPCGLAVADTPVEAYRKARECDPVSAFGGVIGLNRSLDAETAEEICSTFIECVIAPSCTPEALAILAKKKNLRVLETGPFTPKGDIRYLKTIVGGALLQTRDLGSVGAAQLKTVTKAQPTEDDIRGLLFAWKCVKWVKSNAIVYATKDALVGVGAGQMSRVDSARFGAEKARTPLAGTYLASDAFFPFRDGVDAAAAAGVRAVIQPGGSVRDEEVIQAADEHGLIMVFTGMRHFRH